MKVYYHHMVINNRKDRKLNSKEIFNSLYYGVVELKRPRISENIFNCHIFSTFKIF